MSEHTLGESRFLTLSDGRNLHYRQRGSGGPTVVLESGMGFSSAIWGMVVPGVAEDTTTIAYDRAGAGKSDWDSGERTLDRVVDDLEQLLDHLAGPFILVGYSWGGPIVRRMAARRTADIHGLVLLDQVDERDPEYFRPEQKLATGLLRSWLLWFKHTIGLWPAAMKILTSMPMDCRLEIVFRDVLMKGAALYTVELGHFTPGLKLLRDEADRLEGIDVTVVTGTDPDSMDREYRPAMVKAHMETAEALERGTLVEAPNSAHFTPISEPDLVVREIVKLANRLR